MSDLIVNLLPLTLGAAIAPVYSIAALVLLQSPSGLLKSTAFVAGSVFVRLIQGVVFGLVIGTSCKSNAEPGPRFIVSTLQLVLGILLLIAAFRKSRKQSDPDDPPPQWMNTMAGLSALQAAGAGALFPIIAVKQWVFTLSAIGVIGEFGPGGRTDIIAYLAFVLATQALVLAPIIASAFAPRRSAQPLQATQQWLERNNQAIVVAMSLVFGTWFLWKGVNGLIG